MDEKTFREKWEKTLGGSPDRSTLSAGATIKPPAGEREAKPRDAGSLFLPRMTLSGGATLRGAGSAPAGTLSGATVGGGSAAAPGTLSSGATLSPGASEGRAAAPGGTPALADFQILSEIGRGGMGVVYRARQASLDREVALKAILPGQTSDSARSKFLAEALVTGVLDHPNIVPVHELGRTPDGDVFLAMKLVGGTSWKDLLHPVTDAHREKAKAYDLEGHVGILLNVCNAVAFAHTKGVVHRDLKPENVMVGEFGEVLVMDWGIAVDVREAPGKDTRAPHKSTVTAPSGTPVYMPPELAEGRGPDIGPWTDVYLLGAILHEVVTGRPPHEGTTLLSVLLAASRSEPKAYGPDVPSALANICRRAMAKEAKDRYASAEEFQGALRTYLKYRESMAIAEKADAELAALAREGTELAARDRNALYARYAKAVARYEQALELWEGNEGAKGGARKARLAYGRAALSLGDLGLAEAQAAPLAGDDGEANALREEIRKAQEARARSAKAARWMKGGLVGATAAIVVGLAVGFLLVNTERKKAETERDKAEASRMEAEASRMEAEAAKEKEAEQRKAAEAARNSAQEQEREARHQAGIGDQRQASTLQGARNSFQAAMLAARAIAFEGFGTPPSGLEKDEVFREKLQRDSDAWLAARGVALASTGPRPVWVSPVAKHHAGTIHALAYSPDGKTLGSASEDGTVRLWDRATGRCRAILRGHAQGVLDLAFDPSSRVVASGSRDGAVRLWETASGAALTTLSALEGEAACLSFAPDGKRLAAGSSKGEIVLWDPPYSGRPAVLPRHRAAVTALAFAPDGTFLASSSLDSTVNVWDLPAGTLRTTLRTDAPPAEFEVRPGQQFVLGVVSLILDLGVDRPGRTVIALEHVPVKDVYHTNDKGWIRVRSLAGGGVERETECGLATFLAVRPDGTAAAASGAGRVLLWDLAGAGDPRTVDVAAGTGAIAFSPDGGCLACVEGGTEIVQRSSSTLERLTQPRGHGAPVVRLGLGERDSLLVSVGENGEALVWDPCSGERVGAAAIPPAACAVRLGAIEARHERFKTGSVEIGAKAGGPPLSIGWMQPVAEEYLSVALGIPGGPWAFGEHTSRGAFVNVLRPGAPGPLRIPCGSLILRCLALSVDGALVAAGCDDHSIHLWETAEGKEVSVLTGHRDGVCGLDFHPRAPLLASASRDGSVRLWHTITGDLVYAVAEHEGAVRSVAFLDGGSRMAAGGEDRTVRLWILPQFPVLHAWRAHERGADCLAFRPDGHSLATGGNDNLVKVWDLTTGLGRSSQPARFNVSGVAWSPDGKTLATTTGNVLRRNWEDTSESGDIALRDPESLEVRKAEGWFSNAGDTVGGLVRWGVAYSPDGRTLAVADDGCSVNWVGAEDFRTPCILAARHTGEVTSVAIRPDGTMLAGGSKDGSVSRVRLSGLEASEPFFLRGHQGPVNSVAFSADGALLASASSDRTVRLWEAETGRLSRTLRRHDALLTAVAFGRDGRFMASGGSDGSVFLWDAKSFQPLASFHDHTDAVRAVAFCPNGRLLGSASFDGTVRLRPVDPEDLSMYLSFGRFEGLDFRIDLVNPSLDTRENPLDVLRSLGGK